jgi:hypothetical protein
VGSEKLVAPLDKVSTPLIFEDIEAIDPSARFSGSSLEMRICRAFQGAQGEKIW